MDYTNIFLRYVVALAIGFLVGLQREFSFANHDREHATGVRTFALLGLFGCASAHASALAGSPLIFAAALVVVGAFLAVDYFIEATAGRLGLTTKTAALITVMTGGLVFLNQMGLAVALGVAVTVVLSVKPEINRFVQKITREDVYATLKFAVISAIVLPLLPDKAYGPEPFNLFNPLKVWLLVVLISAISFVGYVLIKTVGSERGIGLTGFLGGVVSSTAVTLSLTQRSKRNADLSRSLAFAIIVAWTVMYVRVLIVVAALNMSLVALLWLPMVASAALACGYCFYLYRKQRSETASHEVLFSNPFELGPAIKFGLLFTVILVVAKVGQVYLGNTGIYLSSFVAGLADVDAIALSMARLSAATGGVDTRVAAQAIVIATVANTLLKGGIVVAAGAPALKRAIAPGCILMAAAGAALVFMV